MKKIICLGIEQSPPDWSLWRKVIDRSQYLNFDSNTFPSVVRFCNILNIKGNNNEIEILGRIGSPSADAEVYKIRFNDIEFALKLMPRIDKDSLVKNTQELQIAETASKYPKYFPLTFGKGYCSESSFYVSENGDVSPFTPKAIEFYGYQKLSRQISNKNLLKRFENDYRSNKSLDELSDKYNLIESKENLIEVDFLISELCNGDMGNWMKISHSLSEWKCVLKNILEGIYFMTGFLNIVHPDLHVGNILINTSLKGNPIALIHDFGRCYFIQENEQSYKGSLYSFCTEFISCSSTRNDLIVSREVLASVQNILIYINKTKINRENIKDIYDNVLIPIIDDI